MHLFDAETEALPPFKKEKKNIRINVQQEA
jgi:hypothetical protein